MANKDGGSNRDYMWSLIIAVASAATPSLVEFLLDKLDSKRGKSSEEKESIDGDGNGEK